MNMQKKLNVVLVTLTIVLVSLVSFGGIYYRNKSEMSNHLPQYLLGTDLKGYRQVTLKVASDENENESEAEEENDENSESEEATDENTEESTNTEAENNENEEKNEDVDNKDNYKKSAEIYKNRLKSLKVDNYSVSCDEETGRIVITIPENDETDTILSDLSQQGKFSIKDSDTEEELLTNDDVRSVKVGRNTSSAGVSTTYMSVYFNTRGTNKFKNVTENYQNNVEENNVEENTEDESEQENAVEENTTEETTEEGNSEENQVSENGEDNTEKEDASDDSEDEKSGKQITLNIDDVTMMTTSFQEIIDNGVLSLTLGESQDSTMDELYSAYNLGAIIENDALPIKYEIEGNTYISSDIEEDELKSIVYVEIGLALIIMLIMIAKYRLKGLLSSILSIGYIAILLIAIRYANVSVSILGLYAIEICYIINSIYSIMKFDMNKDEKLTKKEKARTKKELVKRYILSLVPVLIIAIVCCFTQWLQLLSFGMILFWGIIIGLAYNIVLDKILD